ncbi:flagellar basal body rod protein FlgB [Paenibacillus pasadenensis]|uniref:flagellar basal body rod protein FlgB n=1 Tax=Paenibacillus pasadenensis TaxID=217090 RepID=UPI0027D8879B|nr:flagellar basal body rod protein FlgB [Paenibacillus pasadenensis]
MRAAESRQQIISDNISNAETPFFKRSELVFEELLAEQLGTSGSGTLELIRTNERHLPIGPGASVPAPKLVTDETSVMNNNGSNVDVEREMALLAKNQLKYNSYVQQINHEITMLRTAIDGRG